MYRKDELDCNTKKCYGSYFGHCNAKLKTSLTNKKLDDRIFDQGSSINDVRFKGEVVSKIRIFGGLYQISFSCIENC